MASPQLENGFTQIANELLERLTFACLSAKEMSVMLLLARLSYSAFKRKSVSLPINHLSSFLELDKSNVSRLLKKMQDKGLILCAKPRQGRLPAEYAIQKNWRLWTTGRNTLWPPTMGLKETLEDIPLSCEASATEHVAQRNSNDSLGCAASATQHVAQRNSSDRESHPVVEFGGRPRIREGGKKKKTPQPPKGERGGVTGISESEIAEARNTLYKITKVFPEPKDFIRVRSVTRSLTPPDWNQANWHQHCLRVTTEFLRKVAKRKEKGDEINCVYAVACSLAKKQLLTDALHPEEFEGDYDETA